MPVKFGKSVAVRDRNTGKTTIQHDYMKCKSTGELIEVFNKDGTRPKLRQKVKNELEDGTKASNFHKQVPPHKTICVGNLFDGINTYQNLI